VSHESGPIGPIHHRYGALGLPPQRLDANSLLELAFLLEQLTNKVEKRD